MKRRLFINTKCYFVGSLKDSKKTERPHMLDRPGLLVQLDVGGLESCIYIVDDQRVQENPQRLPIPPNICTCH